MFHSARIKLTLWSIAIVMAVSLLFSSFIYQVLINEVRRFELNHRIRLQERLESNITTPSFAPRLMRKQMVFLEDSELIDDAQNHILTSLLLLNSGIFVLSGLLGYILSGRTLRPIHTMMCEQNRFISDASHELKTPLTSLKTAFEVYLRGKNPNLNDAKILIAESLTEVNKLQSLSEYLLNLAATENPHENQKLKNINISEVLQMAIKKMSPLAKKRSITINKLLSSIVTKGDKVSLSQVFIILIDNAVKYSPIKSTVSITLFREKSYAVITVEDQGIGIAKSDLPYVFDRFYRSDKARIKSDANGFGLGLSIAKKIVEQHHGTITVESKENKGSTFTIKLPL